MEQNFQDYSMTGQAGNEFREPRLNRARFAMRIMLAAFLVMGLIISAPFASQNAPSLPDISKSAADSCDAKVKRLASIDAARKPSQPQTTRFSEAEWNSYMALRLSPNYHPSLREIYFRFEKDRLRATAKVDFDKLSFDSTQAVTRLIRSMLTGVHSLEVAGSLLASAGKATFQLQEARFDNLPLPNLLVTEMLAAVGRRQVPPIDPTQPNALPYHISKIEVNSGFFTVYQ
jgi:hypothetical protein